MNDAAHRPANTPIASMDAGYTQAEPAQDPCRAIGKRLADAMRAKDEEAKAAAMKEIATSPSPSACIEWARRELAGAR